MFRRLTRNHSRMTLAACIAMSGVAAWGLAHTEDSGTATAGQPQTPAYAGGLPRPAAAGEAAAHRASAKAAAGTRWENAYGYLCSTGPRVFNNVLDAPIEPQTIFDDVSIVGDRGTAVFALKSTAGVVLIDSSYPTKTESVLLPSLIKLGIDPSSVKYILLTHGHSDHYGGARYFQSSYGTHVVASAADWDLIANAPGAPARDISVGDGDQILLGDLRIKTYLLPGHTPGTLGFIFPVHDQGNIRTAGLFGGIILGAGHATDTELREYVRSLAHFADVAKKNHVNVEIQNHPLFDDTWTKAGILQSRAAGTSNPFVIGEPSYQAFLTVISQCMQATLMERT
jgi:metallo-beta-lactamase class B